MSLNDIVKTLKKEFELNLVDNIYDNTKDLKSSLSKVVSSMSTLSATVKNLDSFLTSWSSSDTDEDGWNDIFAQAKADLLKKADSMRNYNEVHRTNYPWIDYDKTTDATGLDYHGNPNKPIAWYMDKKIRILFESKYMPRGYPIFYRHYVGYYSSIGFFIPDGWVVHLDETGRKWDSSFKWRWRKVLLMYTGNEVMKAMQNMIPFTFENVAIQGIAENYLVPWKIVDYISFPNTQNNQFIKANWDRIERRLSRWGY